MMPTDDTSDLAHQVHIRSFDLDPGPAKVAQYAACLNDAERERASRFRFERHSRRFVVARGVLRSILATYAGCDPAAICFAYGTHGKPRIAGPARGYHLEFSLSHCNEMGAVAITLNDALGLDIEQARPHTDYALIASNEFTDEEKTWLKAVPEPMRADAFLELWTCKEAYLKGKGVGLSIPLREFSIAWDEAGQPRLAWSRIDSHDTQRWHLHRVLIEPRCIGCLALSGRSRGIHLASWPA